MWQTLAEWGPRGCSYRPRGCSLTPPPKAIKKSVAALNILYGEDATAQRRLIGSRGFMTLHQLERCGVLRGVVPTWLSTLLAELLLCSFRRSPLLLARKACW